jgi:hypothetical protein
VYLLHACMPRRRRSLFAGDRVSRRRRGLSTAACGALTADQGADSPVLDVHLNLALKTKLMMDLISRAMQFTLMITGIYKYRSRDSWTC